MFTIVQIKAAHSKVKSGADFPQYVQDIRQMGVSGYETYVADGHTLYSGKDNFSIRSEPKYETLTVAAASNAVRFINDLKEHQQGKTGYFTFCTHCAAAGVEKWVVDTEAMTCTYYDQAGDQLLVETIPVPQ